MTGGEPSIRTATPGDAGAIAALHADSWRRNYRGAYSDAYLDGDVESDRREVWTGRLRHPPPRCQLTLITEEAGTLLGFGHAVFGADPHWGALLDNLHVAAGRQRRGVGTQLLRRIATEVAARESGLYLWVQEPNREARAFYAARGGRVAGREPIEDPGGVPGRLNGTPYKLRVVWAPAALPAV